MSKSRFAVRRNRALLVSSAIAGSLAFMASPALAANECGPATPGGTVTCPTGTLAGISYAAPNGLTVNIPGTTTVTTSGVALTAGTGNLAVNAAPASSINNTQTTGFLAGIVVNSTNGNAAVTADKVRANFGVAVRADASAAGTASVITKDVSSNNSFGIIALGKNGATVESLFASSSGSATSASLIPAAILAGSSSGQVVITAINTSASGNGASAIVARGAGGVTINAGFTSTTGGSMFNAYGDDATPYGIRVLSGGAVNVSSQTLTTAGEDGMGINVQGLDASTPGAITITSNSLSTLGNFANGIMAIGSVNDITVHSTNLVVNGNSSKGIIAATTSGKITVDATSTQTKGTTHDNTTSDYDSKFAPIYGADIKNRVLSNNAILAVSTTGDITVNNGTASTANDMFASAIMAYSAQGGTVDVTSQTATGSSVGGYGVSATGGAVTVHSGTASGYFGVFGYATNGNADVTSGVATSNGNGNGYAVAAISNTGTATVHSATATATGPGAIGIVANGATGASVTSGVVHTTGPLLYSAPANLNFTAAGIASTVTNGDIFVDAGETTTLGSAATGIFTWAKNGKITVKADTTATSGAGAAGIGATATGDIDITANLTATHGGAVTIQNVNGTVTGRTIFYGDAIDANSSAGKVTIHATNTSATGAGSSAIHASGKTGVDIVAGTVSTTGGSMFNTYGDDGTPYGIRVESDGVVNVTATTVTTTGEDGMGVHVVGLTGPRAAATNVTTGTINTAGNYANGLVVLNGAGAVDVHAGTTVVTGNSSKGIAVATTTGNVSITATDTQAKGTSHDTSLTDFNANFAPIYGSAIGSRFIANNGIMAGTTTGNITIVSGNASTVDANGAAIFAYSGNASGAGGGAIDITSGTASATGLGANAIYANGGSVKLAVNGATTSTTTAAPVINSYAQSGLSDIDINAMVTTANGVGAVIGGGGGAFDIDIASGGGLVGSGAGLILNAGTGAADINNAGVIRQTTTVAGPNTPLGALVVNGSAGAVVTNSGTIATAIPGGKAIVFNNGASNDTLNVLTGSVITGRVDGGAGVDTANYIGTSATKTTTQTGASLVNFETLNVNSGYWTQSSELRVSTATIASGATLHLDAQGGREGYFSSPDAGGSLNLTVNGKLIIDDPDTGIYGGGVNLAGAGSIDLIGGGTTRLTGADTFTGLTTITNGTFILNASAPGDFALGANGTLRIGANVTAGPTVDDPGVLVAGGSTTGAVGGNIASAGQVIFDRSDASTYAGVLSGAGAVTKTGTGVLTLSGQNTYTGATAVQQGGLVITGGYASASTALSGGTSLTFNTPNALTYTGPITGAGGVVKAGSSTLTLGGVNTYTGGTQVTGGGLKVTGSVIGLVNLTQGTSLEVAQGASARAVAGTGVTVTNAGTIETPLITTGTTSTVSLGGTAASTVSNSGLIKSYNGHAILFGSGDDTLNLSTGSTIVGLVDMGAGNDTINLAGTSTTKTASQVLGSVSGSEILNVNSGYWTLAGEVDATSATIASGATFEVDEVANPNVGINHTAPLDVAIAGKLVMNTADASLYSDADNNRISGAGQIEIKGGGTFELGANTNFTGLTTVTNGRLVVLGNLAGSVDVAAGSFLRVGGVFTDGATTFGTGGSAAGSVAGNISNAGTVGFDRSNAYTYAGVISGTGTVNKLGTGVLTLSGANTYTGVTNIFAGGLTVTGALASSQIHANNGSALTFGNANAMTYAGIISGDGSLTKSGAGALTLSGANTLTGPTTVAAGSLVVSGSLAGAVTVNSGATLALGAGGATGSVAGTIVDNGNVTFNRSDAVTYAGVISGTGSLTKTGAGTLTFGQVQTYTGATTVSGGTLLLTNTLTSNTTVNAGGTLQIGNGGTTGGLIGTLVDNGTVIFNRSDDYTLAGAFSGTGSLVKKGAGKLTLDGLYTFSGTTTIEAGTIKITQLDAGGALVIGSGSTVDLSGASQTVGGLQGGSGSTVNINNGSLTVNNTGQSNTYSGGITGAGSLTVAGSGTTDLAGANTYTGQTTINGGTLKVNGSTTSNTVVNTGGTLGGSGSIGGSVTVNNGGILSPGNSPGTLTIAGPLTLAAGSTYAVEIDPTATPNHDQVNVTGATTIATGAKLQVRPLGAIGNYARTQSYTILTSTGGVTGRFAAGDISTTMALLTPTVSYTANAVSLRLVRNDITFASLAATSNQAAVGAAAEASGVGAAAYEALVTQDQAGARTGYDALSGEAYGAVGSLLLNQNRITRDALLSQARGEARGAWLQVNDDTATLDASTNFAKARDKGFGLIGGGQAQAGGITLGFALGYGKSDMDVAARGSSADVESFHGGAYAGGMAGAVRLTGGFDYGQASVESTRAVVFPGVNQTLRGDYDVTQTSVFGEVAYPTKLGGWNVEPFAGLGHVRAKSDAFSETGGTMALNVAAQSRTLTTTHIGLRIDGEWKMGSGAVYPRLSAAWQHASGDVAGRSLAAFGTSGFTVNGAGLAENAAAIDAGLGFDLGAGKAWISYNGLVSSEGNSNGVKAGVAFKF